MEIFIPEEPQSILIGFDKKKKHTFFYYSLVFAVKGNAIKKYDLRDGDNLSGEFVDVIASFFEKHDVSPVINIGELETSTTENPNVMTTTIKSKS